MIVSEENFKKGIQDVQIFNKINSKNFFLIKKCL